MSENPQRPGSTIARRVNMTPVDAVLTEEEEVVKAVAVATLDIEKYIVIPAKQGAAQGSVIDENGIPSRRVKLRIESFFSGKGVLDEKLWEEVKLRVDKGQKVVFELAQTPIESDDDAINGKLPVVVKEV